MGYEDEWQQPQTPEGQVTEKKEPERLNFQLLKDIKDKCTREYEAKYKEPLFGINVELSENEICEIEKLIRLTKENIEKMTNDEKIGPLWEKFRDRLADKRTKFGSLLVEDQTIIADDDATDVLKKRADIGKKGKNIPVISVPQAVRDIHMRRNALEDVVTDLRLYKGGNLDKTSARIFGEKLRMLYSFF